MGKGLAIICLLFTAIISLIFSRLHLVEGMESNRIPMNEIQHNEIPKNEIQQNEMPSTPIRKHEKTSSSSKHYDTTGVYHYLFSDANSSDSFRILSP